MRVLASADVVMLDEEFRNMAAVGLGLIVFMLAVIMVVLMGRNGG